MSKTLKIEVAIDDLDPNGVIASEFPTKDYVDSELSKRVSLGEDGKIVASQLPDYDQIAGLPEKFEDIEEDIVASKTQAVTDSQSYTDTKLSTELAKKADLVEGKIPHQQLPYPVNFEQNIANEFTEVRQEIDAGNQTLMQAIGTSENNTKIYVDSKVNEQREYIDNTFSEFEQQVNAQVNDFDNRLEASESAIVHYNKGETPLYVSTLAPYKKGSRILLDSGVEYVNNVDDNAANPNVNTTGWSSKIYHTSQIDYKWKSKSGGYALNDRVMLENGDIVKNTMPNNTTDPNVDMTGWVKVNSTKNIFDDLFGLSQSVINGNVITVDNFGAKGDGITDDSAAFQAYCDSPLTGQNLYLGAKGRYIIKNQVDLKGKGLVGNGCGKVSEFYYNLGCIDVDGSSPSLTNKSAFINCGPTIQNVTARCSNGAGKQVSFIEIDGYLANIDHITLVNFYNQIVVKQALVGFNFTNAWLYYSRNAGIYCEDPLNRVSTTGTFHNIYFQLGDGYSMIFDRDIHGCDFGNIIFESMNGGIKARTVAHCGFGKFWCENLKTETSKDWLEVTGTNSCYGNSFYAYTKLLGGWTSKTSPTLDSLPTNNYGGVSVSAEGIAIVNAGNKAKMLMLPSGFKTGNATIDETHISSSTVTPLVKRRVIGADGSGAQYLASDTYTKLSRKWGTYNHGSNNAGAFYAPMMLTYDQSFSTPQNNNGWQIVKESTGVYRVERVSGNTSVITNGHIVVGSPLMGSRLGTGTGATHGVQMIETYPGSWTSFTEAAGFKVFWRDAAGTLVDPHRFTVAFTATS